MWYMFYKCSNFDCDLSNWNVSKVKDMSHMFANCEKFKGNGLGKWDVSYVTDISSMFLNSGIQQYPSWYNE